MPRSWFPEQTEGPSRFLPTALVIPGDARASTATRTSRRGWAWPTTCSATAGRRSRPTWASTWRAWAFPATTPTRTRRCGCRHTAAVVRPVGRHAGLDRRQQQLRPGLRPARIPRAGSARSRRRFLRRRVERRASAQPSLTNNFDPALLNGWGVRPSDWTLGASVQQQLAAARLGGGRLYPPLVPRLHRERQPDPGEPSDYSHVQRHGAVRSAAARTAAATSFSGLYDVAPSLVRTDQQLHHRFGAITATGSSNFNGVDVTLNVRLRSGWTFQGGTSTGQSRGGQLRGARQSAGTDWQPHSGLPGLTTSPCQHDRARTATSTTAG